MVALGRFELNSKAVFVFSFNSAGASVQPVAPLVDRNPQVFVNIATAKPEDFKKATQRIYRKADAASVLSVLILPPRQ